jgi:hypothetical protein
MRTENHDWTSVSVASELAASLAAAHFTAVLSHVPITKQGAQSIIITAEEGLSLKRTSIVNNNPTPPNVLSPAAINKVVFRDIGCDIGSPEYADECETFAARH